jgi:hypothetical protein
VSSFKEIEISEEEPPPWLWHDTHHMHTHPFIKLIKHHQGVVVQVVRPAPKEARKKDVKQVRFSPCMHACILLENVQARPVS